MARRPAATRNKWVRLPLASLYRHPSLQGSALQRTELVALPHTLVAHSASKCLHESTDALARASSLYLGLLIKRREWESNPLIPGCSRTPSRLALAPFYFFDS